MDQEAALKTAKKYIEYLIKMDYKINEAYLFGSYSKGRADENSDLDIAIIADNIKSAYDELFKLMKYRRDIDIRIEPHLFPLKDFDESNPYRHEILSTGIRII